MESDCLAVNLHPGSLDYELAGFAKRDTTKLQYGINEVTLKVFWLRNSGTNLVFVSLDALYFPEFIADYIYLYFSENFNIDQNNIICNATHTHSSPNFSLPYFGKISSRYVDFVISKMELCFSKLGQSFKSCSLTFNEVDNPHKNTIGRRRLVRDVFKCFFNKTMFMLPNINQLIDDRLRILTVIGNNNEIVGVIYNVSCHPVFGTSELISSDFPGLVNSQLEQTNNVFTMFLQGFCGDIRPNITTRSFINQSIKQNVKSLVYGEVFRKTTPNDLQIFSTEIAETLNDNFRGGNKVISKFNSHSFVFSFESYTGKTNKESVIKLFSFDNIVGVSIPAEVLSGYYHLLNKAFPKITFIPLGFSEGMLGYLPLYSQVSEKGYEVTSYKNYGWDSHLDSKNLKKFIDALIKNISQVVSLVKE